MRFYWGGSPPGLLPLDGCGWFAGDIQADAVDAFDLVNDPVGDALQEVIGELDPVCGHAVERFHPIQLLLQKEHNTGFPMSKTVSGEEFGN